MLKRPPKTGVTYMTTRAKSFKGFKSERGRREHRTFKKTSVVRAIMIIRDGKKW